MKIGAFAAAHKVSIDAIRYYIDLGLLLPEKHGGQYSFDERCGSDLEEVNSLKAMGFTLSEIRTVFLFRRLGRMTACKEDAFVHELFVNKYGKVSELLEELKQISSRLENKIRELEDTRRESPLRLGIQLRNLEILRCPRCKGELNLRKAQIEDNQIMEGMLECRCGVKMNIRDGILMQGVPDQANIAREMTDTAENRISDYIKNTDEAYLKNVSKGLEWAYRRLNFNELGGRVLLELGSGFGFFLRLIYDELPENTLYIAVDYDILMHRYLKQLLENSGKRRNVLFICADFLQVPIRDKAADIVLDLTGTSNYSFEHEEFLLRPALRYFGDKADLLGNYILFGNFSSDSRVAANLRKNFKIETIKKEITALGFEIIHEAVTDYLDKGGIYENYFTDRERVNSCAVYAKRSGTHEV